MGFDHLAIEAYRERFMRVCIDAGARIAHGKLHNEFNDALNAYIEPHRCYHTMQHISECLELFDWATSMMSVDRAIELELAIWYHDFVYDIDPDRRPGDNEIESAIEMTQRLRNARVPRDRVRFIDGLIRATQVRSHYGMNHIESALVCDIDLAILGVGQDRYDEYAAQICAEYSHIDHSRYVYGRSQFLRGMLDRSEPIFQTDMFRERFEHAAHENMMRELKGLEG